MGHICAAHRYPQECQWNGPPPPPLSLQLAPVSPVLTTKLAPGSPVPTGSLPLDPAAPDPHHPRPDAGPFSSRPVCILLAWSPYLPTQVWAAPCPSPSHSMGSPISIQACPHHSCSPFSVPGTGCSRLSLHSPCPALNSAISARSPGVF